MKLVFLGTTGYHPSDRRQTACIMLPELGILLDAGTAMYRARHYLQTKTLDIFLTHAHLDHVAGLTFIFDVMNNHPLDRMTLHGDPEKLKAVDEHLFTELLFPVKSPFTYAPLTDRFELPDGGRLTHFPVKHPGGAIAFRLDWPDRSMAYVTDTTANPKADYVEKIRGVDLLIHECYFPDGWEEKAELTGHSCTTPVAQVAKAAGVGRMLLVHMTPLDDSDDPIGIDKAKAIFPATQYAEDGMEVEF